MNASPVTDDELRELAKSLSVYMNTFGDGALVRYGHAVIELYLEKLNEPTSRVSSF